MNKDSVASAYDNPLWKSFYIPKDKITTRFIEFYEKSVFVKLSVFQT